MPISKRNAKAAGTNFENRVRERLRQDGYKVIRSAGSLTSCDMVAIKAGEVLFVQCKAGVAGDGQPGLISPHERFELLTLAECLPVAASAIVAYQVKIGRCHAMQFKRLFGISPDAWESWTPDRVIVDE